MTNLIPKVPDQISAVYLPNTLVLPTKRALGVSALQKPPVSIKKNFSYSISSIHEETSPLERLGWFREHDLLLLVT